jgi:hypothetical protein
MPTVRDYKRILLKIIFDQFDKRCAILSNFQFYRIVINDITQCLSIIPLLGQMRDTMFGIRSIFFANKTKTTRISRNCIMASSGSIFRK